MATSNPTEVVETLAAEIGDNIYMDIAKWHLYLANAHLHTLLAERLYPMVVEGKVDPDRIQEILQSIPIKLGGGRREIPLIDLLPMQCQVTLVDLLEDFIRRL
ncbi:DUF3181 family protein [Trichothermofontia sichuanensis B231]|uniref:DUF3181 family protein n=1 Tax=Trichothermofontia sichuanensis TaxID=3045816 RepID=UPI0022457EB5|nr:DUF3181 family protein [Trichothermofontia sichuanensis]UZQ54669.1 DUF3181 family protein [Trichothermofontia sichuanensis B231]